MDSGDTPPVTLERLLAKAVLPEAAMQVLLGKYRRLSERLDQIEGELAYERGVFRQYGGPGDLELHRQQVAPLERAREELLDAVRTGVLNSLRNAAWLAFGLRMPIDHASRPVAIAPVLWHVLELDFANAIARGGGREYRGVRIVLPDRCTDAEVQLLGLLVERLMAPAPAPVEPTGAGPRDGAGPPAQGTAPVEGGGGGAGEESRAERRRDAQPSFPGRPSMMRAIEQEMRRRAGDGELCATLAAECRALAAWAAERFRGHQTPTAKTIENGLRLVYWQLNPRKTPGN